MKNKFGLSRQIPSEIRKEIRRRSKFGCVVCRCGIYQYEHISPEFSDTKIHDPKSICCLCGRCHDKVTRRQLSKEFVKAAYERVQLTADVQPPREFLDFHTGTSLLKIGGLNAEFTQQSVYNCYQQDVFSVEQRPTGEPGAMFATFSDDNGVELFRIDGNEWIGPTTYFDLEIVGPVFSVKLPSGRQALRLRHEAPGIIVIELIDMRYKDIHLLASENDLAIGKYTGFGSNLVWLHTKARVSSIVIPGSIVKAGEPDTLLGRVTAKAPLIFNQQGILERVLTSDPSLLSRYDGTACGIHWPGPGIQIAEGCGFSFGALCVGVCSIEHARNHFFKKSRMNIPTMLIPATINTASLDRERQLVPNVVENLVRVPSSFLALPDIDSVKKWRRRLVQRPNLGKKFYTGTFHDDKPGLFGAWGAIKLVDAYAGPALRVAKK